MVLVLSSYVPHTTSWWWLKMCFDSGIFHRWYERYSDSLRARGRNA